MTRVGAAAERLRAALAEESGEVLRETSVRVPQLPDESGRFWKEPAGSPQVPLSRRIKERYL